MDTNSKQRLGHAMWQRAELLGYPNQRALADASQVSKRTIGPLIAGTWGNQPTGRTLNALEDALALTRNTLVTAFQGDAGPSTITAQPLTGPQDPAAWLVQYLATRGVDVDPVRLRTQASRLDGELPGIARMLAALAELTEGHGTVLVPVPADGDGPPVMTPRAVRARLRRRTAGVQHPLLQAAGA